MSDSDDKKPHGREPSETPEASSADAEAAAKAKAAAEAKAAAAKAKAEAEAAKPAWEKDPATPEWVEEAEDSLVVELRQEHDGAVLTARSFAGDLVVEVNRGAIRDVCRSLKERHGYTLLVDLCGAHYPEREQAPLEVIYIFYSLEDNRRVRLKVSLAEGEEVPSLTPVYAGANWPEREAYDMYGIRFAQHPDMTRILLWEGFDGHPLRKEFPLEGVDTGAAIYPEYYADEAGPVAGTGTGWRPPAPEEPTESDAGGSPEPQDD